MRVRVFLCGTVAAGSGRCQRPRSGSVHQSGEAVEQIGDVVRAWRRFGVSLEAEDRPIGTCHALQAIQALGGFGYTNESNAGRLLRDAKLYEIGAGTSEIRRMLIGRELFNATA